MFKNSACISHLGNRPLSHLRLAHPHRRQCFLDNPSWSVSLLPHTVGCPTSHFSTSHIYLHHPTIFTPYLSHKEPHAIPQTYCLVLHYFFTIYPSFVILHKCLHYLLCLTGKLSQSFQDQTRTAPHLWETFWKVPELVWPWIAFVLS